MTRIFAALKALPLIRFALMLGGGMTATSFIGLNYWLLGFKAWAPATEAVAVALIYGLTALGLAGYAIVAVVMIALAWGRVEKLAASFNGASVELNLEGEDPQ